MKPDKREKRDKALAPSRFRTLLPWAALATVLALSVFVVVPRLADRWTNFGVRVSQSGTWTLRTASWLNGQSTASPWRADPGNVRTLATAGAVGACILAGIALPVLASRNAKARRPLMVAGWLLSAASVAWLGVVIVPVELAMLLS